MGARSWVTVQGLYRPFKGPKDCDVTTTVIRPITDFNAVI